MSPHGNGHARSLIGHPGAQRLKSRFYLRSLVSGRPLGSSGRCPPPPSPRWRSPPCGSSGICRCSGCRAHISRALESSPWASGFTCWESSTHPSSAPRCRRRPTARRRQSPSPLLSISAASSSLLCCARRSFGGPVPHACRPHYHPVGAEDASGASRGRAVQVAGASARLAQAGFRAHTTMPRCGPERCPGVGNACRPITV